GAHPDPAAGLAAAVREANEAASRQGRALSVVGSITGTDRDPQGLELQRETLTAAGVRVMETGYDAARLACAIVTKLERRGA
ncbi:MAG: FdrA family protein, partial [Candidatus Bipolaricaulota bacterium]